jgi:hypothetical protein
MVAMDVSNHEDVSMLAQALNIDLAAPLYK